MPKTVSYGLWQFALFRGKLICIFSSPVERDFVLSDSFKNFFFMIWFGFKTPFKKRQLSFTFSSLVNTLYNSLLSIKCSRKSSFFFLIAIALVNLNVLFQYSTGIDGRLVKGKKTPKTKPSLLLPNKREVNPNFVFWL